jgi:tRNA dimethylallyltransferase
MKPKVLVILGPTASGKSALSVELARRFNGEIISADSRQVYRGLDIGTGKITKREMKSVPHHLLDVADPSRKFSSAAFQKKAATVLRKISKAGALTIIVGGTGYYIDALLGRIVVPDVKPNLSLRKKLEAKSTNQLYALLQKRDPERAASIEPHNKRRLIRALEIIDALGAVPKATSVSPYNVHWIGTLLPLAHLEKKIRTRLKGRIKTGMIAEARRLHRAGLSYRRMRELGLEYRWLADLLEAKISRAEFEDGLYRDIRRYAKKQIAYWKRNSEIQWFDPRKIRPIEKVVSAWLQH